MPLTSPGSAPEQSAHPAPSVEFSSNLGAVVGLFYGMAETLLSVGVLSLSGILVSRAVGKTDFGIWSTASLLLSLLVIATSLRAELTLAQLIGRARGEAQERPDLVSIVRPALWISVVLSVMAALALVVVRELVPVSSGVRRLFSMLALISIALLPMSISLVLTGALRGLERMRQAAIARSLPYVVWLAAACGVALARGTLAAFVVAYIVSFLATTLYLMYRYRSLFLRSSAIVPSSQSRREFISAGLPLMTAMLFGRGSSQLSNYMVAFWLGNAAAGAFNAGFTIAAVLQTGVLSLVGIFVPMIARLMASGETMMATRVYQRATRWLFVPVLALAVSAVVYAPAVLGIYGTSFEAHAGAFRLLVFGFVLDVSLGPNRAFLVAIGRNDVILWLNILSMVVSLVANVVLIEPYGVNGAATATLLGMFSSNVLTAYILWRDFACQPFTLRYIKLVLFGILTAVLLALILVLVLGTQLLAGVVYGALYTAILGLWIWRSDFVDAGDRELGMWLKQRFGWQRSA